MSKKPGIPAFKAELSSMYRALELIRQNVEQITGVRGGPIEQLPATATPAEIIRKINEIIGRLNARGE